MDDLLIEWRQLKERSAKLVAKLKLPSEPTAQMIANNKQGQLSQDNPNKIVQSLWASRAPLDALLHRLSIRQAMIEDIEMRYNSKADN